jgi:hypothetical protein
MYMSMGINDIVLAVLHGGGGGGGERRIGWPALIVLSL